MVEHLLLEAADADVPPAGRGTSLVARKGMRAAPLPRCTVTGVTADVSVPHVLGVPVAQPAASVGARLGMGEDIVLVAVIKGCCSWVVRFDFANQIFWAPLKLST